MDVIEAMADAAVGLDDVAPPTLLQLDRLLVGKRQRAGKRKQSGQAGAEDPSLVHGPASARRQGDALDEVVVIAGRVEDELTDLRLPGAIGGLGEDHVLPALRRRPSEAPRPEGEAAVILAESRVLPALAAVR